MTLLSTELNTDFKKLDAILEATSLQHVEKHTERLARKFSWNFLSLNALKENITLIYDYIFNNPRSEANTLDFNRASNILSSVKYLKKESDTPEKILNTNKMIIELAYSVLQSDSKTFKDELLRNMITFEPCKDGRARGFYPDSAFGNKAFVPNEIAAYRLAQTLNSYSYDQTKKACNILLESDMKKLKIEVNPGALNVLLAKAPSVDP